MQSDKPDDELPADETFTGFAARKPLPLVHQRQVAKRATAGSETATCPLG